MTTLYLDASALSGWSNCREFFRRQQIVRQELTKENPHYVFGKAMHLAVEEFWKGNTYDQALNAAYEVCNQYPVETLNPAETETWTRLVKCTPDLVACYFNSVTYEPEQLLAVEQEWSIPYDIEGKMSGPVVTLCGRMDRLAVGPRLVDVKTASEIASAGIPWKQGYRQDKILDLQFALYDWYLCQQGTPPIEIYLEVLLKPYKGKAARYEKIDLSILLTDSYRKRFRQQLAWKVSEIVHYVENYSQQVPWPLAGPLACSSKYGKCQFLDICCFGDEEKILKKYKRREPHLELVRIGEAQ